MWQYQQSSGQLRSAAGALAGSGYSGRGDGLNNAAMEQSPNVGPIPAGLWSMGAPFDSAEHGPFAIPLVPHSGTQTFGRDGFMIHGDEVAHAGEHLASEGCIILGPDVRRAVWASGDHILRVIP